MATRILTIMACNPNPTPTNALGHIALPIYLA